MRRLLTCIFDGTKTIEPEIRIFVSTLNTTVCELIGYDVEQFNKKAYRVWQYFVCPGSNVL